VRLELGCRRRVTDGADKICATTPDRRFSLRTVACFGQCALAPCGGGGPRIYGHLNEQACTARWSSEREEGVIRIQDIGTFSAVREAGMAKLLPRGPESG